MPMPTGYMPASTSLAAFKRLRSTGALTDLEEAVLQVIRDFGPGGCIFDQVQEKLPHLPNSVSGRFLSLERKGWIVRAGDTRPGRTGNKQKVMRHRDFVTAPPPITSGKKPKNAFLAGVIHATKLLAGSPSKEAALTVLKAELRRIGKLPVP